VDAIDQNRRYTYADYLTWDDDKRYELIDGVPYLMSPGPNRAHQGILRELSLRIGIFLEDHPCKLYFAPFDVRLNADDEDDTVVQPDLVVVCDGSKLDDHGCVGAPDFAIEILSPSSARHDMLKKYKLYQKVGIPEYWIVDPDRKLLQVCLLENGKYVISTHGDDETVPVHALPGCEINLRDIFAE